MRTKRAQLGLLLVLFTAGGLLVWKQQSLLDWWHLRNYHPSSQIAQLASEDTMTPKAERLFYVNKPQVSSGSAFTQKCPTGTEKTVVLGCYIGRDKGIYISSVSDPRLNGVEQVTAAHEMLHAAYRRLSSSERQKVDAMLMDYYQHNLTDQRIKDTMAAYQKSEPNDVVNEMHSIFGTEIANLPAPLEQYYQQYFTDRSKVAAYTASYQSEFTSRQAQVAAYDTQLSQMKSQIDSNLSQISAQKASLDSQNQTLQSEFASGQISAYNSGVVAYNQAVRSYNTLAADTRKLINQYNDIVDKRNALALEEQQLTSELSASSVPASK